MTISTMEYNKEWLFFFFFCFAAWGILVPQPGIEPGLGSESTKY